MSIIFRLFSQLTKILNSGPGVFGLSFLFSPSRFKFLVAFSRGDARLRRPKNKLVHLHPMPVPCPVTTQFDHINIDTSTTSRPILSFNLHTIPGL